MPSASELALPDDLLPRQDFFIIGAFKSPGVCTFRGVGSPRKWDIRAGYGISGATTVFMGNQPAQFECDVSIWTKAQKFDWDTTMVPFLKKSPPGQRPQVALSISHPLLNDEPINITQVVVEDVTAWEQDEHGLWTCTIKFLEWKKPLPALGKPIAAIPAASKAAPSAQDAADLELKASLEAFKAAAAGP